MNYYEILEVSQGASLEVIRAAYKAQAAKYHPDNLKVRDEDKMKEINIAFETLSDPLLRAEYDKKLMKEGTENSNAENIKKDVASQNVNEKQEDVNQGKTKKIKLKWYVSMPVIWLTLYFFFPVAIILYAMRIVQIKRKPDLFHRKRKIFNTCLLPVFVAFILGIAYLGMNEDNTSGASNIQKEADIEKKEEQGETKEQIALANTETEEQNTEIEEQTVLVNTETEEQNSGNIESDKKEWNLVYDGAEILSSLDRYTYDENPYYLEGIDKYIEACNTMYEEMGSRQKMEKDSLDHILKEAGISGSMRKKIISAEGANVLMNQEIVRIEEKNDKKLFFGKGAYYEISTLAKDNLQMYGNEESTYYAIYYLGDIKQNKPNGEGAIFILMDDGIHLLGAGNFKEGRLQGKGVLFSVQGYGISVAEISTYENGMQNGKCTKFNTADSADLYTLYHNAWNEYSETYFYGYEENTQNEIIGYLFERDSLAQGVTMKILYEPKNDEDFFVIHINSPVIRPIIKYEGDMKNGEYNGKGKIYGNFGTLWYEGELKNGNVTGKGKLYYALTDTVEYEGEFYKGKFHGKGKLYNEDGTLRKKGKFDGEEPDSEYESIEQISLYSGLLEKYYDEGVQKFIEKDKVRNMDSVDDYYYEDEEYNYDSEDYSYGEDEEYNYEDEEEYSEDEEYNYEEDYNYGEDEEYNYDNVDY